MTPLNFSSYSRDTLEHTLRILSIYRSSLKQIGKRAELIDPTIIQPLLTRIEYAPGMDASSIKKYADACIHFSFPEYVSTATPVIRENSRLTG